MQNEIEINYTKKSEASFTIIVKIIFPETERENRVAYFNARCLILKSQGLK